MLVIYVYYLTNESAFPRVARMRTHSTQIELEVTTSNPQAGGTNFRTKWFSIVMFQENINLANYSSYKIGGPAKYFFKAKTINELTWAIQKAKEENLTIFILGGGTNLLIADAGFPGLVIQPDLLEIKSEKSTLTAEAGLSMSDVLAYSINQSLSGLEWAGGLPGTLGGAIRGNAGAFGGEIKDTIKEVFSLNIKLNKPKIIKRTNAECRFSYRNSIFKERDGEEIILAAVLQLRAGDQNQIRQAIEEKIQYRKDKHPMEYPNVGSIFKNVPLAQVSPEAKKLLEQLDPKFPVKDDPFPVIPTAYLIAQAGLKGLSSGGARVSEKHPNFIINFNHAKASDVKELIVLIKAKVKEKFNIQLEEEVIYL